MRTILLIILGLIMTSCEPERKQFLTAKMPLRQLVNSINTTTKADGWFFLVSGGYSSSAQTKSTIKMYALVNGAYKFLEFDMKSVRIHVDNSVTAPYIVCYYSSNRNRVISDETVTNHLFLIDKVVLHTSEKYLPEQLLPINIK